MTPKNHWSERGRATSVPNADALGRPRRSVLAFGRFTRTDTSTQMKGTGAKGQALDRYAKTAKRIEKKIQDEVYRDVQPPLAGDIAHFERLQAEVDLARYSGRLPAKEE